MYYFKRRFCFLPHFYVEKQGGKKPQGTCPTPIPWILGFVSPDCWGMDLSGRGAQLVWVGELVEEGGAWLLTPQLPEGWEFRPEITILSISLESAKGGNTDTVSPEWFFTCEINYISVFKSSIWLLCKTTKKKKKTGKAREKSPIILLFMGNCLWWLM